MEDRIQQGLALLGYIKSDRVASPNNMVAALEAFYTQPETMEALEGMGALPYDRSLLRAGTYDTGRIETHLQAVMGARVETTFLQMRSDSHDIHRQHIAWLRNYNGPISSEIVQFILQEPSPKSAAPPPDFTVYIDAGHGHWRAGELNAGRIIRKSNSEVIEADLNWAHASKLKDALEERGFRVVMIRDDPWNLGKPIEERYDSASDTRNQTFADRKQDLEHRVHYAAADCDAQHPPNHHALFISVHADYFSKNPNVSGIRNYVARDSYRYDPNSQEALKRSKQFAALLSESFNNDAYDQNAQPGLDDAKTLPRNFIVLTEATKIGMPSILIETGFMSNKRDLARLQDPERQCNLAEQIANSVVAYEAQLRAETKEKSEVKQQAGRGR
jgi:N-acetylmuramoyl-L-alanine amidase